MSGKVKFLIGLAAVLLMGWLHHGPLGQGSALIDRLESTAKAAVAKTEVPGVEVALSRDPLSRQATLSGAADEFQREGQGELKGLNDIVSEIEGVSGVQWADRPAAESGMPLLLESLIPLIITYLLGLGIAWLLFGQAKKETYL